MKIKTIFQHQLTFMTNKKKRKTKKKFPKYKKKEEKKFSFAVWERVKRMQQHTRNTAKRKSSFLLLLPLCCVLNEWRLNVVSQSATRTRIAFLSAPSVGWMNLVTWLLESLQLFPFANYLIARGQITFVLKKKFCFQNKTKLFFYNSFQVHVYACVECWNKDFVLGCPLENTPIQSRFVWRSDSALDRGRPTKPVMVSPFNKMLINQSFQP